ncbi:MAG: aldo/keto reductase [Alphaproteobacteria bacterium]|nr:aldo/keto reductase [Alphaproteobacteria bacterium]
MRYVALGRSGLMVSAVCLGGNSWGAAGRRAWGAFGLEESKPFFRRALDVGINFFDTADAYNEGESESIIGETLISYAPRHEIVISTKVGMKMGPKPNDAGIGRKHLMHALDQQLRRLKTDHIDLYQLHRLDTVTPLEEVMETLDMMVRAGKVRHIGGSVMPAYKFAQMIMLADWKGVARPIAMQNLYNLVQREEEREMNRLCAEQGVGLIPFSPLARGFLAANRARGGGGATERAKEDQIARRMELRDCDFAIADQVAAIAAARGIKPTQVALAWLLSKPAVVSPIIGATRPEYLDDAAAASEIRLSTEEIASLETPYVFRAPPAD